MRAHDIFRLSLSEAIKHMKRSPLFRHVLFAVGEVNDPLEPNSPFNMQAVLPEIEREWHFCRDAVPDYIKLFVGRAARERTLAGLEEEYSLQPAERFRRVEGSIKAYQYCVHDPQTWDTPFFCVIRIPAELSGQGLPIFWCGNRSTALVNQWVRPWFFDARAKVLHGQEAVALARQAVKQLPSAIVLYNKEGAEMQASCKLPAAPSKPREGTGGND